MGWRALRLSLARSTLMKAQARALIEASGGQAFEGHVSDGVGAVGIMKKRGRCSKSRSNGKKGQSAGPERNCVRSELEGSKSCGNARPATSLGSIFISIGTNDLTFIFLFCGRPLGPRPCTTLRLAQSRNPSIFETDSGCLLARLEVPVRICGEMAGRPLEAMALVGIGAENVSITPAAVGPIKAMVRSLDVGGCSGLGSTNCLPGRPATCAKRLPIGLGAIPS